MNQILLTKQMAEDYKKELLIRKEIRLNKEKGLIEQNVGEMNNIQVSGSNMLQTTQQPKKENLIYKAGFVFSLICALTFGGLSVYAAYDRNKNEETSKNILASIVEKNKEEKVTSERIILEEDTVVVILNNETEEPKINIANLVNKEKEQNKNYIEVQLTENGETYYVVGTITIPKINVNYPVLSETSDELLKISPCKYWGGDLNTVGNVCITGHNYLNSKFFSKVPTLQNGDIIELTDINGNTMQYSVYAKYVINEDDMSHTSQLTDGNIELTLITCTTVKTERLVVKARAI